jgi:hypothetical protein
MTQQNNVGQWEYPYVETINMELTKKLTLPEYLRVEAIVALHDFQNATGCAAPEQLEDWQKFKPVLVGWSNPKDLEKMHGGAWCAMVWNDQLEPAMIPLYMLTT